MVDPFVQFASDHGLLLRAEPLPVAPRNLLNPINAVEQHFLVELSRSHAPPGAAVRLIFALPAAGGGTPLMREVLWWLAGDAWAIDRCGGHMDEWAAAYGYPSGKAATTRLFELHRKQAQALVDVLGEFGYRRLLAIYEAEVAPP
jgi:hypothetical protein